MPNVGLGPEADSVDLGRNRTIAAGAAFVTIQNSHLGWLWVSWDKLNNTEFV
jgi:hypothetical protein